MARRWTAFRSRSGCTTSPPRTPSTASSPSRLRLAREFDWDYLKPQSRAQCFAEAWGLSYQASGERATPFTPTHVAVRRGRRPAPAAAGEPVGRCARRAAGGAAADPGRRGRRSAHHLDGVLADDGGALSADRRRRAGAGHRARGAEGARGRAGRHRPHADAVRAPGAGRGRRWALLRDQRRAARPALGRGVPPLPAALRSADPRRPSRRPRSTRSTSAVPACTSTSSSTTRPRPSRGRWATAILRCGRRIAGRVGR